jgi:hypothetical protein
MNSLKQRSVANEIAHAEQECRSDAASITNWYQLRRNQALMELERLETAYNERMAEHSVEWSQRLSDLYSERDMYRCQGPNSDELRSLEFPRYPTAPCGSPDIFAVPPIPKLTRQSNWHIMPQEEIDAIEQEMLDDSFPPLVRQQNVQYLSPGDVDYTSLPVAPMDLYLEEEQQHVIDVLAHMSSVHIVSDDEDEEEGGIGSSSGEEMC